MERSEYINVKQAAERYGVSRAKLHRLIKKGRLRASRDPRDERATLLRIEDLDEIFVPSDLTKGSDGMVSDLGSDKHIAPGLTPELCEKMDELRLRISRGGKLSSDSAELIRRERAKRTRQLQRAASPLAERISRPKINT
ncbi:MAG: helix-turn-helix domain-containing protein [Chloroflexi bacterium]|nr:helix-turn-helix domain-containing protein [Chloroflexota bacterium]